MIRIGSPHPFDPGGPCSLLFGYCQPLVCDLAVTLPCLVKLWWFVIFVPPPCSPSANLTSPLCSLSILLTIFSVKLSFMGLNWIFIHRLRAVCGAPPPLLLAILRCGSAAATPQSRAQRAICGTLPPPLLACYFARSSPGASVRRLTRWRCVRHAAFFGTCRIPTIASPCGPPASSLPETRLMCFAH